MLEVSGGADAKRLRVAVKLAARGVPRGVHSGYVRIGVSSVTCGPVGEWSTVPVATGLEGVDLVVVERDAFVGALAGDGRVACVVEGGVLVVACGRMVSRLAMVPADDVPVMPAPALSAFCSIDACCLPGVLAHASRDDSRPVLTCVRVELDGGSVRLAATDSYRLIVADRCGYAFAADAATILVPRWALACFVKSRDAVTLAVADGWCAITDGTRTILVRIVEGQFPDVERLFPEGLPILAQVRRDVLADALAPFASRAGIRHPMVVESGRFALDTGEGSCMEAASPVTFEGFEGDRFGVHASFLLDAVEACGDVVTLRMATPLRPLLLESAGVRIIVMPVRLAG